MASAIGIGRFIYTPILPAMAEGLGLTKGEAGLIASANFAGYLIGAVAAASPRLGRQRFWLLSTLAVSAATTAAMAWPEGMDAFLVLRFLGGAASAYVLVLASALVLERLAVTGNSAYSPIHFSGVGSGIAASALLTWAVASHGLGWRAMWLAGGLASIAGLAAVALLVPQAEPSRPQQAGGNGAANLPLMLLTLAYGLFGFGYVITATFIVVIVRGSPQALAIEPVFWLAFGLSAIPSVAFWVGRGRRMRVLPAFAVACIVEAIGVFASVAWPGISGLMLASLLLGGTFMGITALGLMAARDLAPANPRRWLAILTAAFGLGQIVGPIIAGYGYDLAGSFFLPSMLAVAALLVSASLAMAVDRRHPA
ncbi:MAG: YbfB/YjiJ family MFS transporter [Hyphomicrobiaceae bacterium]|nr:MAG: YbfB/YjiJ family MFS transporter [Hyphomicrobiaceae bacterium]